MKRSEGSYTVEAAIIIPLLLAIILALIQICFVLHDRVVIRAVLEWSVLQAAEDVAYPEDGGETDEEWFDIADIEKKLLISRITDLESNKRQSGYETRVCIKTRSLVPIYFGSGESIVAECAATRKRSYAKEKVIISEVLLDALQVLQ